MERQQHTNPWAEKLLQVSMPDSAGAWTAMEALLDRKITERRARDRRRWVLLILLLLLLIGVCNCPGRGRFFHDIRTARKTAPSGGIAPPGTTTPVSGGNSSMPVPGGSSSMPESGVTPSAPAAVPPVNTTPVPGSKPSAPAAVPPVNTTPAPGSKPSAPARATVPSGSGPNGASRGSKLPKSPGVAAHHPAYPTDGAVARQQSHYSDADTSSEQSRVTSSQPSPIVNAPVKPKAATNTPGAVPEKTAAKDSTHKKPAPKPQDQQPPENQHGWMIGAGVNQFFPIGGQQGSTFNSNGLTGTLSDYLPVPMVRYYFNPRLYIQLEAQFNTPQATKKNLVINAPRPDTSFIPGSSIVSTASLRQLYYFNVPLSVHFEPWHNLDIGTGLQFSHLSNAIGDFDSTITNTSTSAVENTKAVRSFKGDTLYQRIKTNEFRFLLDVNYTYKHFIFGLRYNQALSNFVNIQLSSGQVTQSRNSSLQLYLRYILFDTRKKKADGPDGSKTANR